MSADDDVLARIHDIRPAFNRAFDRPLYWAAAAVTALMLVLPYAGRIALALLLNVFFNRLSVYRSVLARRVLKPAAGLVSDALYLTVVGLYALAWRAAGGAPRAAPPSGPDDAARYARQF